MVAIWKRVMAGGSCKRSRLDDTNGLAAAHREGVEKHAALFFPRQAGRPGKSETGGGMVFAAKLLVGLMFGIFAGAAGQFPDDGFIFFVHGRMAFGAA